MTSTDLLIAIASANLITTTATLIYTTKAYTTIKQINQTQDLQLRFFGPKTVTNIRNLLVDIACTINAETTQNNPTTTRFRHIQKGMMFRLNSREPYRRAITDATSMNTYPQDDYFITWREGNEIFGMRSDGNTEVQVIE